MLRFRFCSFLFCHFLSFLVFARQVFQLRRKLDRLWGNKSCTSELFCVLSCACVAVFFIIICVISFVRRSLTVVATLKQICTKDPKTRNKRKRSGINANGVKCLRLFYICPVSGAGRRSRRFTVRTGPRATSAPTPPISFLLRGTARRCEGRFRSRKKAHAAPSEKKK